MSLRPPFLPYKPTPRTLLIVRRSFHIHSLPLPTSLPSSHPIGLQGRTCLPRTQLLPMRGICSCTFSVMHVTFPATCCRCLIPSWPLAIDTERLHPMLSIHLVPARTDPLPSPASQRIPATPTIRICLGTLHSAPFDSQATLRLVCLCTCPSSPSSCLKRTFYKGKSPCPLPLIPAAFPEAPYGPASSDPCHLLKHLHGRCGTRAFCPRGFPENCYFLAAVAHSAYPSQTPQDRIWATSRTLALQKPSH